MSKEPEFNYDFYNDYKDNIILKGDVIESFERVEPITEIILLGAKGGIRRITLKNERRDTN